MYLALVNNKKLVRQFMYYIGEDVINMIRRDVDGAVDASDVRTIFY